MSEKKQQNVDEKTERPENQDKTTKDLDLPEGQSKSVKGGIIKKFDQK